MAEIDTNKITTAATTVMQALEGLSAEERARVLQSVAALHGIGIASRVQTSESKPDLLNTGTSQATASESVKGKRRSVVEFLNEKQPATNGQRIALFAFYREHVEMKGSTFARKDLEGYFAAAKLPKPGRNYDRDFVKAVKAGWIHEDGANSYLTQAGEAVVGKGFAGKGPPRGSGLSRRKAAAKTK